MDANEPKSGTKRQCDHHAENLSSKHHRSEPPPADEAAQPTKITDIDDDCLEKIFKSFDLQNLFNVAVANEWLRPAANAVYKRKFGTKKIYLLQVHFDLNSQSPINGTNAITINDFKTCLQFLRFFGSSITHLEVNYGGSISKRYNYVHQYINNYCNESLITLRFVQRPIFSIGHFEKPFVNVQNVGFHFCDLSDKCLQFADVFPGVRRLNLQGYGLNQRFIDVHPTHLEHLIIAVTDNEYYHITKRYNAMSKLVQSNRQLQSLTIKPSKLKPMTMESLLNMIEHNQLISKLVVSETFKSERVKTSEIRRLAREHPVLVELDLRHYQFTTKNVMAMIQQLSTLKKFCFRVRDSRVCVNIASKLDEGWQCNIIYNTFVTLNRQN